MCLLCLMRQNKIYGFTLADQDWIGLMIFKNSADQNLIGFKFCSSGLDSDWKISQSAHLCWTGLGLVWIQTIANFVEIGLDPECKSLQNFAFRSDLDRVDAKEMWHFCCEKAAFFIFFGLHLDLDFTFEKKLDCGWTWNWVLKNQD